MQNLSFVISPLSRTIVLSRSASRRIYGSARWRGHYRPLLLRGDARDTKGTNPMASQGGCCRSGPIHPADPRHPRLITGLAGLTCGLSTLFATDPEEPPGADWPFP